METVYLNLLVSILFTTSSLHLLEASPCSCNGVTTSEGWGECKTIYMGKPWCYIDNEANCEDRMVSSKTNKGFSFQACENQIAQSSPCSCNGLISSRGGECTKKYRGRLWCYVSPEAGCVDRKESQTIEGESWSFQACQESNSEGLGCVTKGGQSCVFPFKFKGQDFSSCTTTESMNGRPWCATRVGGDGNVVSNRWEDCDMDTCGGLTASEVSQECMVESVGGCVFPFQYGNNIYGKCTMEDSSRAWCAIEVDAGGDMVRRGDCSENLSNVECFPEEFWDNVRVFDAAEDGTIPCEDENDCPDYDISTMRRILGLSDAWQPTLFCNYDRFDDRDMTKECRLGRGTQLGCGVDFDGNQCELEDYSNEALGCSVDIQGDRCEPAFNSGGTPLSYTTSTGSAGGVTLSHTTSTSSQALIQPISSVTGECSSSTCRRGNLCCPVVWAGSNRQFICPPYC